jgi:hypothetical protein
LNPLLKNEEPSLLFWEVPCFPKLKKLDCWLFVLRDMLPKKDPLFELLVFGLFHDGVLSVVNVYANKNY